MQLQISQRGGAGFGPWLRLVSLLCSEGRRPRPRIPGQPALFSQLVCFLATGAFLLQNGVSTRVLRPECGSGGWALAFARRSDLYDSRAVTVW